MTAPSPSLEATRDVAAEGVPNPSRNPEETVLSTRGHEFVLLAIPDVNGTIRGKAMRRDEFDSAVRGGARLTNLLLALDPVDEPITSYEEIGIRSGAQDLFIEPDVETLRPLSWAPGWSICLATPRWPDGSPCLLSPRELLRNALAELGELGYETLCAIEYEVRFFDEASGEPVSGSVSYSASGIARQAELLSRISEAADGLGIDLTAAHTEAGPGLIEFNLGARPGLRAADDGALLKFAVKEVAASMGLRASFLAKPAAEQEGSSGHVHVSLWSNGENAFAGGPTIQPFAGAIAGMLEQLPAASLLMNPTINSYKRLIPGWFAPVNASWGIENRSCALRAIWGDGSSKARIECRRPGADANPYLVLAGLIAAATDGIQRQATPPEPIVGDACDQPNVDPLPGSLEEAVRAFEDAPEFRAALGEEFCAYYEISRRWELKAWRECVTEWETKRYEGAV